MARAELGRFLRDRREALLPGDVGLPAGARRRTPGLRREEVAGLASMSVEYYARLEQARGPQPSRRILDALTAALRLDPAERRHLFRLAGAAPIAPPGPVRHVRPHVAGLLHRVDAAAVVTSAAYDIVAWNPLAEALLSNLGTEPNLARRHFLGRTPGTEEFGHIVVARLRAAADRYPHDERLAALLTELRASAEFRHVWGLNPVRAAGHRSKTLTHPRLGPLRVDCDVLEVPDDDQQVVFITADPGSASARALDELAGRRLSSPGPGAIRSRCEN
ncbi:helix-turn-helix transcriptional regulator [Dactylosporangium sp. NPDC049140]|uniref:helix-turn-helix transcriptional regulator n=1 Tax=Dactylosporangium sp. NPDC049140 TaxID=3155647 RepID=UPI0033DC5A99